MPEPKSYEDWLAWYETERFPATLWIMQSITDDWLEDGREEVARCLATWVDRGINFSDPKTLKSLVEEQFELYDEKFADVSWTTEDVIQEAEEMGITLTEEQAKAFLARHERRLQEVQVERGWAAIVDWLSEDFGPERTP